MLYDNAALMRLWGVSSQSVSLRLRKLREAGHPGVQKISQKYVLEVATEADARALRPPPPGRRWPPPS